MQKVLLLLLLIISYMPVTVAQNKARYSDVKASMKKPQLEAHALYVANKRAAALRCKEEFKIAKIVSDDWEVMRNDHGMIIARYIHMELYGETTDGRCGMSHCIFRQNMLADNTYSPRLKVENLGAFYDLECE